MLASDNLSSVIKAGDFSFSFFDKPLPVLSFVRLQCPDDCLDVIVFCLQ